MDAVRELEEQVSLMNPSVLDAVGRRVSALSSELEKMIKLRKRNARQHGEEGENGGGGGSSEDSNAVQVRHQHVDALYALVESLGALDKELPLVVERLETLQTLHGETSSFAHRLRQAEESVAHARTETKEYAKAVAAMEHSVAANVGMMSKNMAMLDGK